MIDFTKSKQYTLSIRISTDGFSFSIYNPIHDDSFACLLYTSSPEGGYDTSMFSQAIDYMSVPYTRTFGPVSYTHR